MANSLTAEQRGRITEKLTEWGNLVFVGMVVVQLVRVPFADPGVTLMGVGELIAA